ncbi:pyridoxal phosphate-dependent transferase [Plectosphaerella plurivora]|uniref:Pyridoxal phosphate-dependent transferase n=1 Tax=Plectosphaerella plurivora TaxID=936078 RepID=A0A9P9AEF9_9PEZI|nr:pyridoxal phosphate-dependent transferase [Plectosphaerella plurivora]
MPDLSHHINRKSKARQPSPLKDIIKFMGQDGMISLAGGLPHPSLFPVEQANFNCITPLAPLHGEGNGSRSAGETADLTIGRDLNGGGLDLTQFLQYGSGAGNRQLIDLCKQLTDKVHTPPATYDCILHPGNTNAWAKVVGLLCEDDDYVLVEEYTYPSAQAHWIPLGIRAAPVSADADGIQAIHLNDILEGWDEAKMGARRPRVLYLVAVGSNPTGITISAARRREIYELSVKYDLIIVEDDPYYFLQYPGYNPSAQTTSTFKAKEPSDFIGSLIPSFLSLDIEGRVIRLESFSKTLFPGLRLGYFIANPTFIERLLRATEVETQDPAGLSQAFILSLFGNWGVDGYLQWLQRLQFQYQTRRNWLLDAFYANFVVLPAAESPVADAQGLVACIKSQSDQSLRPVFSFVDPGAGMFVWSEFYFEGVTRFAEIEKEGGEDPEQAFAGELWKAWATELVLLTPGSYYHPWQGKDKTTTKARGAVARTAHFRFSFATPTVEQIATGVERVRSVVDRYWV